MVFLLLLHCYIHLKKKKNPSLTLTNLLEFHMATSILKAQVKYLKKNKARKRINIFDVSESLKILKSYEISFFQSWLNLYKWKIERLVVISENPWRSPSILAYNVLVSMSIKRIKLISIDTMSTDYQMPGMYQHQNNKQDEICISILKH